MGYDVSFHPVDVDFIQKRLLPCITGEMPIEPIAQQIARLSQVRFRANAWGLGTMSAAEPPPKAPPKLTLMERLLGKRRKPPSQPKPAFESDLYVWGRPFFITSKTSAEVSAAIDRYLEADLKSVDRIAQEMIEIFDPKLVDRVSPDNSGEPPDCTAVIKSVQNQFGQLANAWSACGTGQSIPGPQGQFIQPEEFLANYLPLTVFTMAADFRPGWMARGYVWPTAFLSAARLDWQQFFTTARELFRPLLDRVPQIGSKLQPEITSNFTIGGFVPAERVAPLIRFLQENRKAILAPAAAEKWGDEAALCLQKIGEALHDAHTRGIAFAEASEIYSGPMGIMN